MGDRPVGGPCAVAVFAVFAAPVVLAGEPTFAGYIKLDDTATWFAITDRVMEHGRSLDGLAPSSYEATLAFNLGDGYPIGASCRSASARELAGRTSPGCSSPTWRSSPRCWRSPSMCSSASLVEPRPLRATCRHSSASQPALLFAYSLWGGVKEVAAAWH